MKISLYALGIVCFGGILIEDFRSGEIHIGWFVGAILLGITGLLISDNPFTWNELLINLLSVTGILAATFLIFKLRKQGRFWDAYLGLGDAAMLYCLCFWLNPMGLLSLFIGSTWISVLVLGGLIWMKKIDPQRFPIPLAGIWALGWMVIFALDKLGLSLNEGGMLW